MARRARCLLNDVKRHLDGCADHAAKRCETRQYPVRDQGIQQMHVVTTGYDEDGRAVLPSRSVKRKVTVPLGHSAICVPRNKQRPTGPHGRAPGQPANRGAGQVDTSKHTGCSLFKDTRWHQP